jgi:hypothetical protein
MARRPPLLVPAIIIAGLLLVLQLALGQRLG